MKKPCNESECTYPEVVSFAAISLVFATLQISVLEDASLR